MASPTLQFSVSGDPVPKGRPRAFAMRTKSGKSSARLYTPAATRAWEAAVRAHAMRAVGLWRLENHVDWPLDAPGYVLEVCVRRAAARGDLDNYLKAVSDALNGVAWRDDARVRALRAWAVDGSEPGVDVVVQVGEVP